MRCEKCLNRVSVISENGIHYNCSLSEKKAVDCICHRKDYYIEHPIFKNDIENIEIGDKNEI